MLVVTLFLCLLLWREDIAYGLRIVELRAPTHEREGGVALLGCEYDLEDDMLYSVKWYKDRDEFFRYLPSNDPTMMYFSAPGVNVDMSRSSSNVVALVNLTRESSGIYRCEVSGEAPSFQTTSKEKRLIIHYLPQGGPRVSISQRYIYPGELVELNCTSAPSWPDAELKWLINDGPVSTHHAYITGPSRMIVPESTGAIEVKSQLRFYSSTDLFEHGPIRIKCQATVAPLYQRETVTEVQLLQPSSSEDTFSPDTGSIAKGVSLQNKLCLLITAISTLTIFQHVIFRY